MSVSLSQPERIKSELMGLISQSFQTNLNLLNYLERSGIALTEEEWAAVLRNPKELSNFGEKVPEEPRDSDWASSICKDGVQLESLKEVRDRMKEVSASILSLKTQINEFEKIASADPGRPESQQELILRTAECDMRLAEIQAHLEKLDTFEQTHLDSSFDS